MFDENKLYMTRDAELLALAPYMTWAHWRSEGRGPAFIKIGARVAYAGRDLNTWLDDQKVQPRATGDGARAAA